MTSHQARASRNNIPTSIDQRGRRGKSNEHKNQRLHFKKVDPSQAHKRRDRCSKHGDSKHVEDFECPVRKFQCKTCNKYGHFTSLCYKSNHLLCQEIPGHINCKWEVFICKKIPYVVSQVI